MKYIIWYKKEVIANDLKEALNIEDKVKAEFSSIEVDDDPQEEIGFKESPPKIN